VPLMIGSTNKKHFLPILFGTWREIQTSNNTSLKSPLKSHIHRSSQ
jgi:hypothetical protein